MRTRPHLLTALAVLLIAAAAQATEFSVAVHDQRGRPLADAVVLAVPQDARTNQRSPGPSEAVDQVDKQFSPYVTPIYVGSMVRFPNHDNVRHQVYSFSPAKKFELPLYAGAEAPPVLFDKPGVVVMGCNIHDWMIGYVYVSETPFFAKTGPTGTATLHELPPGEYRVRIWHPSMEQTEASTVKNIVLRADAAANADWQIAVKPSVRVPRLSGAGGTGYP
jgi:plastocyanin